MSAQPKELGLVHFSRDLDLSFQESARDGRPVLILFDEVPGCATCQGYGESVLSDPLLVEAIETLFVPVAIFNNLGGKDAQALRTFGEPAWNNPVVRIVDAEQRALGPRVAGEYTSAGLLESMVSSLRHAKRPVPGYLQLLADEKAAERKGTVRALLSMYCFWSGEACLGGIEGVIATRTGYVEGREAVEVEIDPSVLGYRDLIARVVEKRCATSVWARTDAEERIALQVGGIEVARTQELLRASAKDDKYQLASTKWKTVHMTRTQATRANALVGAGKDPSPVFSGKQLALVR
jgi:hypothetical protein